MIGRPSASNSVPTHSAPRGGPTPCRRTPNRSRDRATLSPLMSAPTKLIGGNPPRACRRRFRPRAAAGARHRSRPPERNGYGRPLPSARPLGMSGPSAASCKPWLSTSFSSLVVCPRPHGIRRTGFGSPSTLPPGPWLHDFAKLPAQNDLSIQRLRIALGVGGLSVIDDDDAEIAEAGGDEDRR